MVLELSVQKLIMPRCEIEQAKASNDCTFLFSNSSLAFDVGMSKHQFYEIFP